MPITTTPTTTTAAAVAEAAEQQQQLNSTNNNTISINNSNTDCNTNCNNNLGTNSNSRMNPPRFDLIESVSKTSYFSERLNKVLSHLHPTRQCVKLIVKILLHGPDGSGKKMLAKMVAKTLDMKFCEERVSEMFDDTFVGTDRKVRATLSKFSSSAPCIIYLQGYELFTYLEPSELDVIECTIRESLDLLLEQAKQPIVLIASTYEFDRIEKTSLSWMFSRRKIAMRPATYEQAIEIIESIDPLIGPDGTNEIMEILSNREYYMGNLISAIGRFDLNRRLELKKGVSEDNKSHTKSKAKSQTGTRWADIGGLGHIRREIIDSIQLPINYPQLKKRRTGILLYGPPGTGKTLLAKAVATECSLNFINVKGPELLSKYVGESEDNVRKVFQKARESSPSVIFFDEIESLIPTRGEAGDSGGLMNRVVSQFLVEFDRLRQFDGVYVIGATNRVDMIDPSLLRNGRFSKVLEVPLPSTSKDRLEIIEALTRQMELGSDVDLVRLETLARPGLSGADFHGICSRAQHRSFYRAVQLVEKGEATEEEVDIAITMSDFLESIKEMEAPSLQDDLSALSIN